MTLSNQKYLKAVYMLSGGSGSTRVAEIAAALCVSKASVCSALGRLCAKGLVWHEFYGDVSLTPEGAKRARALTASYERLKYALGDETRLPEGFDFLLCGMPGEGLAKAE